MPTLSHLLRYLCIGFVVAVVAVILATSWLLLPVVPEPDFYARKGVLRDALVTRESRLPGARLVEVRLTSSTGLEVELALRLPDTPLPRSPLVVMLAGQETGREAVELIADTHGVAVAALSYPFGVVPHRDGLALSLALRRIQRGILDTPSAVMLALDYLLSRTDLDPERVELVGISFGAFLAAVPAALDERFGRLWLIHGSGDPTTVIEAIMRERIASDKISQAVAWLLAAVASAHHLSPEYWVARVAPRPLVVVNARADSTLPTSAVSVLHDALHPPFEVLWTSGDHVHPKRPETIRRITDLIFRRIIAVKGAAEPVKAG